MITALDLYSTAAGILTQTTPTPGSTPAGSGGDNPTPTGPGLPVTVTSKVDTLLHWMQWLGIAAAIAGIFLVAMHMAMNNDDRRGGTHLGRLGYVAGALILLGSATSIIGFFAS